MLLNNALALTWLAAESAVIDKSQYEEQQLDNNSIIHKPNVIVSDNMYFVPVSVGGGPPRDLLLDTGSSETWAVDCPFVSQNSHMLNKLRINYLSGHLNVTEYASNLKLGNMKSFSSSIGICEVDDLHFSIHPVDNFQGILGLGFTDTEQEKSGRESIVGEFLRNGEYSSFSISLGKTPEFHFVEKEKLSKSRNQSTNDFTSSSQEDDLTLKKTHRSFIPEKRPSSLVSDQDNNNSCHEKYNRVPIQNHDGYWSFKALATIPLLCDDNTQNKNRHYVEEDLINSYIEDYLQDKLPSSYILPNKKSISIIDTATRFTAFPNGFFKIFDPKKCKSILILIENNNFDESKSKIIPFLINSTSYPNSSFENEVIVDPYTKKII